MDIYTVDFDVGDNLDGRVVGKGGRRVAVDNWVDMTDGRQAEVVRSGPVMDALLAHFREPSYCGSNEDHNEDRMASREVVAFLNYIFMNE